MHRRTKHKCHQFQFLDNKDNCYISFANSLPVLKKENKIIWLYFNIAMYWLLLQYIFHLYHKLPRKTAWEKSAKINT